ncbi:hypothetical protein AK821_18395 [Pseudomonas sp. RIT-PI-r]|nr:hypothetical protein AK821_18395 [Pseudomonas sp. RIT-PI-r]
MPLNRDNKPIALLKVKRLAAAKSPISGTTGLDTTTVFLAGFGGRDRPTQSKLNYQTTQGNTSTTVFSG